MAHARGRDVLTAIFAGLTGLVEIRRLPSRQRRFYPIADLARMGSFITPQNGDGIYFGVSTRRSDAGGTLDDCLELGALWVDVDCAPNQTADARARLAALPIPPAIEVLSGSGGVHAYFLLREPADVQTDRAQLTGLLRRLAQLVQADRQSAEPARVLRVPGTFNTKHDPPRPVTIARFEPDRRINLSELDDWLPALETGPASPAPPLTLEEPIVQGRRNDTLYRLCRSLRAKALPAAVIASTAHALNRDRCVPPLETDDVDQILRHALKQPDRPGHDRSAAPPPAPCTLTLATPREIAAMTDPAAHFYAPYIAKGAILELDGYPKRGKTSFLLYLIGCIVHGVPCLDIATQPTGVLYLSEERWPTLRRALDRASLSHAPQLHFVSRWSVPATVPWPAIVDAAVHACQRLAAGVLVVDTLPAWAGLVGDSENNSGDALAAVDPLQRAAAAGLAVVLSRHDRKSGGVVGESGRGSSAFAGSVDTIVSLRKPEGKAPAEQRVLEALSRFDQVPDSLLIERQRIIRNAYIPTGSRFDKHLYRALGAPGQLAADAAETAVLTHLATVDGHLTVADLRSALPELAPVTLTRALTALVMAGRLMRIGKGIKGSPHAYGKACPVENAFHTSIPRGCDDKNPAEAPKTEPDIAPPVHATSADDLPAGLAELTEPDDSDPIGAHDEEDDGGEAF